MLQSLTAQAVGPGLDARVESFLRLRPVEQASQIALRDLVQPAELAGVPALVIGGSRGLGATTDKLIAAGGGKVCITYNRSLAEADAVAHEIQEAGGHCEILRCDATEAIAGQFEPLQLQPSQLYHFATGQIFHQKRVPFEPAFCAEMMQVYKYAFYEHCRFCLERRERLQAFYPLTLAIDEGARDTLEYVTAKSTGEALATLMNKSIPGLTVAIERLPRIETDQTATIFPVPAAAPSTVMLPIIRRMAA